MIDQQRRIVFTQIPKTATTSIFASIHTPDEIWRLRNAFAAALRSGQVTADNEMELVAAERYLRGRQPATEGPDVYPPLAALGFEQQFEHGKAARFLNVCEVGLSLYIRHMTFAQAERMLNSCGDNIETYRSFTFVRNPWDWMLSQYYFSMEYLGRHGAQRPQVSFDAFLAHYAATRGETSEAFCQTEHLMDASGALRIGWIGRFENLCAEARELNEFLGMTPQNLDHLRRTESRPPGHYRQYYSDAGRRLVTSLCEQDIDGFKYCF